MNDFALTSGGDAPSLHRPLWVLACARVTGEPEPGVFALGSAGPDGLLRDRVTALAHRFLDEVAAQLSNLPVSTC